MKSFKKLFFILSVLLLSIACDRMDDYPSDRSVNEVKVVKTLEIKPSAGVTIGDHQFWIDLYNDSVDSKTKNTDWNLGFWAGVGLDRVILNYSVKTQAEEIVGASVIDSALLVNKQAELNTALSNFNAGTYNMGELSTFDFHKEGSFVIGTPETNAKVYLIRVKTEMHPPVNGGPPMPPVTVNYFLASVKKNGSSYDLIYRALNDPSGGTWQFHPDFTANSSIAVSKDANYQYQFVKFGESNLVTIQPKKENWQLALSSVTLKRYMSNGNSYANVLKGVVLNCNPDVEIYKVQSLTTDSAGAPGPYDPNFADPDPALNPINDISAAFTAFTFADVGSSGTFKSTSQEEIGQYWRYLDMGKYRIFVDRFFVIRFKKSGSYVYYKLKFENLVSTTTVNPIKDGIKITYEKLN